MVSLCLSEKFFEYAFCEEILGTTVLVANGADFTRVCVLVVHPSVSPEYTKVASNELTLFVP